MKSLKLHLYLLTLLAVTSFHHANSQTLELKDLNIPNAPAFTILDYSPAVIDKPGTAKAFSANIVSLLGQSQGLPKNFAMEVSPFWLFKNNLNVYRYHGIDSAGRQKNIFANVRNTSISIGSVFRDSGKAHEFNANYLAVGVRVNLIKIIRKPVATETVTALRAIAGRMTALTIPVTAACLATHTVGTPAYNECVEKGLTAAFTGDADMVLQQKRLEKLMAIKPVFQVDIAGAGSWAYKDNTLKNDHRYRTGIWTTMELSVPLSNAKDIEKMLENKNYLNLYGTLRYINEDSTTDFKNFNQQKLLDFGGRLEVEFDKFSLSFESIHRINQSNKDLNTDRNVGIIQYKVNDQLYLSGTFGKNFGTVRNVIALFGLNWGFGKQSLTE